MEQTPLLIVGLILFGYACGLIPTGVLLTRSRGIDLRTAGSGNTGATNVLRTAGIGLGIATLMGDVVKAALPTGVAWIVTGGIEPASIVGLAAVVGHCFPITTGFHGGKGVASALGVLLMVTPAAAGLAVVTFALVVAATRIVSAGSLASALVACGAAILLGAAPTTTSCTIAMAAIIWTRHRANITRLIAGTEPRLSMPRKQASA